MPQAAPGRTVRQTGPFREAIVFMIGGGNYLEYESLVTWAARRCKRLPCIALHSCPPGAVSRMCVRALTE